VDGAHIRTLLLTFFYRQMHELIERGHIYIAQPPLYKVKKGKQEQYLKDDADLNRYLLQTALDNAELHVDADAPAMAGTALEALATQFNGAMATVRRLARRHNPELVEKLIYMPRVTDELMESDEEFNSWIAELAGRLNAERNLSSQFDIALQKGVDEAAGGLLVTLRVHGISDTHRLPLDFFRSGEYAKLADLGEQLASLLGEGAFVKRGEKRQEIASFKQALEWLVEEAKRGQHIQRYKGLGEMNPDQLWETTMNPETRRLLQVSIEDAIGADEIFTTLMGDQVEPRRDFIEKNALAAENIDV
jgi:DNA gyrase subunit B